jgi:hypothetical protein
LTRKAVTRGRPPSTLTGQLPVSGDSPWWRRIASEICHDLDLVGRPLTIEEITQTLPRYPDGRRIRPRTAARRLLEYGAIELVERGPNGSLGRGAKYKILPERPSPPAGDVEPMPDNAEFLEDAVERMTRGKVKR